MGQHAGLASCFLSCYDAQTHLTLQSAALRGIHRRVSRLLSLGYERARDIWAEAMNTL